MRLFLFALFTFFASFSASAAPFLVGDVPGTGDQCVFRRGAVDTPSPIVVDPANGLPAYGNRICKIDLATDPKTGTVSVAVRDSVLNQTSAFVDFTFQPLPSAPTNFRLIP